MKRVWAVWLNVAAGAILAGLGGGCGSLDPHESNFARTALGKASFDEAFEAGEKVMRGEFGRVVANAELAQIEAKPELFTEDSAGIGKAQMRRLAKLRLGQRHGQWWAYLQVQIQRQDTQTYRAFQYQRSGQDHMIPTPMESETSSSASRRQVWTNVRRLHALENELLARIREELGIQSRREE
ncbi:MAG: hypothetical protein JW810_11350 [Sedimentisphaerales bacterium]|nr:hypothetical protein [Sedimentisphaerales bacterium]